MILRYEEGEIIHIRLMETLKEYEYTIVYSQLQKSKTSTMNELPQDRVTTLPPLLLFPQPTKSSPIPPSNTISLKLLPKSSFKI